MSQLQEADREEVCYRCRFPFEPGPKTYVYYDGGLRRIHKQCVVQETKIDNVFRMLGFGPDVKRDHSQPGYHWTSE